MALITTDEGSFRNDASFNPRDAFFSGLGDPGFLGFANQDVLLGLLGALFGGPAGASIGFGGSRLFRDVSQSNLRADQFSGTNVELFDEASESTRDIPRFDARFPGLTKGGEGELDRIDFGDIFTAGQAGSDFITENLPSFEELRIDEIDPARDAIRDIFSNLRSGIDFTPRTQEDLLQGVDLLDTDLSDILGTRLAGIGATSQARETPQLLAAAREAQRSGLGLEGAQRLSSQVGFQEQTARGLEAATVTGQTRVEEQLAAIENARLQSQATSQAELINQGLRGLQANIGVSEAGGEFSLGQLGLNEASLNEQIRSSLFSTGLQGALGPALDAERAGVAGVGFETGQQGVALQVAALQNAIAAAFGGVFQPQQQQTILNPFQTLPFLGNFDRPSEPGTQFGANIDPASIASLIAAIFSGNPAAAAGGPIGSDRNIKHSIVDVNEDEILEGVEHLPVSEWSYDGQDDRHVGPMAQDFKAAFGLGASDKVIEPVDALGVALAAIKALTRRVKDLEREVSNARS